jgi:hypothetical protein
MKESAKHTSVGLKSTGKNKKRKEGTCELNHDARNFSKVTRQRGRSLDLKGKAEKVGEKNVEVRSSQKKTPGRGKDNARSK